jgi:pyridoxal phosphate enzyme (YggS family)
VSQDIAQNIADTRARITAAAAAAGRDPADISLTAVSKLQPAPSVAAALGAGQLVFGENRVEEAEEKFPALKAGHPGLRLHLIGPLQSRKAKAAVALFNVIESLDRPKLAQALAREMEMQGRRPLCLIQVNTGEEPQKSGVAPRDLAGLLDLCRELRLPVEGLMAIPPEADSPGPHFAFLAELAGRHGLRRLSMGMSGDFETAIRFGATDIRIGTALFGLRPLIR